MNPWAVLLQPPDRFLHGLAIGALRINDAANRVVDARSGKFVGALVPGRRLLEQLNAGPVDSSGVLAHVQHIQPLLNAMQLVNSVGAVASVANLGVSVAGFAIVLHRLSRMEGKLDESLTRLKVLQDAVDDIRARHEALTIARIRSAAECLERSLAAENAETRRSDATRARDLFQESRHLYMELWKRTLPFRQLEVDVVTAIEMQSRYVACAIGEMQAEFIRGDMRVFQHTVREIADDYEQFMMLDAAAALRARSDAACSEHPALARFGRALPMLVAQLDRADETARFTLRRLRAYEQDGELPDALSLQPHEVAKALRHAADETVYVLAAPAAYEFS